MFDVRIPHERVVVEAGGDEETVRVAVCERTHPLLVPLQLFLVLPRGRVPETDRAVHTF